MKFPITVTVPRDKLFKAITTDMHDLQKIVPAIQRMETKGTTTTITIIDDGKTKDLLHNVDTIDKDNYVDNFTITGDLGMAGKLQRIQFESKWEVGANGGSVGNIDLQGFTKDGAPISGMEPYKRMVEDLARLIERNL